MRGRCAQSPLCGAFGEGVSVVVWWCVGEVSCLLKERGERRQQSLEGEKKRLRAPMSVGERGDEI